MRDCRKAENLMRFMNVHASERTSKLGIRNVAGKVLIGGSRHGTITSRILWKAMRLGVTHGIDARWNKTGSTFHAVKERMIA